MQQLALDFNPHRDENNYHSRKHLEENRDKFSCQCKLVLTILQSGRRLTVLSAITEYGISSLPRRILDLKENGVEIKDEWRKTEGKTKYKEYFI